MTKPAEDGWLTTTQASARYCVEATTIVQWQMMKNFPDHAKRRRTMGSPAEWHQPTIDEWLRSRPRHRSQRPARWWAVLGIEGYPDRKPVSAAGGRR